MPYAYYRHHYIIFDGFGCRCLSVVLLIWMNIEKEPERNFSHIPHKNNKSIKDHPYTFISPIHRWLWWWWQRPRRGRWRRRRWRRKKEDVAEEKRENFINARQHTFVRSPFIVSRRIRWRHLTCSKFEREIYFTNRISTIPMPRRRVWDTEWIEGQHTKNWETKDTPIKWERERERTREKNVENWSTTGTEGQTRGRPTTKNGNISMEVNYKRYTICNVLRWQIDLVGSFQKQFGCPTERKRMRWKRAVLFFAQVSATLESILRHIQSPLHPGICPRPNWLWPELILFEMNIYIYENNHLLKASAHKPFRYYIQIKLLSIFTASYQFALCSRSKKSLIIMT